MNDYLFRVSILTYPEGSVEPVCHPGEGDRLQWVPVPGWAPPGWQPDADFIKEFGTPEFVWPSTNTTYRSHAGAEKRATLLKSYGATVVIERTVTRWLEVDPVRDGDVVSPYELDEEEWPVLDAPRTLADEEGDREVLEGFGSVAPIAEDLERWCLLPLRLVWNEDDGLELELGPYTLPTHAVDAITSALTSFYAALWAQRPEAYEDRAIS
jgi:hypothetical protein